MKKVFLLVLLATFAIAAYSQTDSTKVKKKKEKFEWISIQGIVADNFTKMGILDVKNHHDEGGLYGNLHLQSLWWLRE